MWNEDSLWKYSKVLLDMRFSGILCVFVAGYVLELLDYMFWLPDC
jgi:hypothetical protein